MKLSLKALFLTAACGAGALIASEQIIEQEEGPFQQVVVAGHPGIHPMPAPGYVTYPEVQHPRPHRVIRRKYTVRDDGFVARKVKIVQEPGEIKQEVKIKHEGPAGEVERKIKTKRFDRSEMIPTEEQL